MGVLLESLGRRGVDDGRRRCLRLLIGTGVLGGFTTYSALAIDTGVLAVSGHVPIAVGYALATIILGAGATFAGIAIAAFAHRRLTPSRDAGAAA